jgi:hypothetical protein
MTLLSDGAKKGLIIGSTAVLPRSARVAMRKSMLADLEVGIAERAKLLIIAHPKSGNTWLKTMISRLYQQRFDLPERLMNKSDEYTRRYPEIPRLAATNGIYSYEGAVGDALKKPGSPLAGKAIVFQPRHPCDIAVSWFLQFTKRQSKHKQELINASIDHPIDKHSISMWDFVRHSDIGLPFLIDYLNGWVEALQHFPNGIMVRYEDLRAEPAQHLARIMDLMGESFSAEEIADAVAWASVDNLKKLESEGYFKQGGMTLRNSADPESFKVRRAKVGGYRDYFNDEQIVEMDTLVTERLSPALGYTAATETHTS